MPSAEDTRRDTKLKESESELLFKDEVYSIVGAAIEVHKELGPGFLEAVYQQALEIELNNRNISFRSQAPMTICYKGKPLDKEYVADLICYQKIVVESKALDIITGREKAQLLNYLKATGLRVGLLMNFGSSKLLEWKRFIM
jgi:GxxExxY protein